MVTTPRKTASDPGAAIASSPARPAPLLDDHNAQAALNRVPHSDDIIEYTLSCVLAMAPQLSQAMLQQANAQVRATFGGDRLYISRRAGEGSSERNAQIKRDYLAGAHIPLLERRYGLKRSRL
jgi:Mor family transcriptional regulator